MRAALTVLFVLLLASPATAQFSINPNSQLQWDQSAATLAAAQGYTYDLAIDAGTSSETIIRLADVTCVKGTSPTSHVCSAPIPAVAVGTHSLRLIAVEERSGPSEHVTVTASQADPRCVFPTGSASVTIFPTRLLTGGQRAGVNFQVVSSQAVRQIDILLKDQATNVVTVAAQIRGELLTDTGGLWFPIPASAKQVQIRAVNALGCASTIATTFVVGPQLED